MRPLLALVLLLQALHFGIANATERYLELVVTEPYLEMHSGPGRGFPVVYTVGRDELVTVLYSRTDWYKIRAPRGQEGWVRRADLMRTVLASGEPAPIPPYPDFSTHRWEVGAGYGVYNRQNLVTAYAGLRNYQQHRRRVRRAAGLGHAGQPVRHLHRPAAYLHTGMEMVLADGRYRDCLSIHRGEGAAAPLEKSNQMAYVSLGARGFITRRFHVARRLAPTTWCSTA